MTSLMTYTEKNYLFLIFVILTRFLLILFKGNEKDRDCFELLMLVIGNGNSWCFWWSYALFKLDSIT